VKYLIDGHNLIPKLPGFSLKALEDERHLINWLQDFCRARRHTVEVFFDGAPAGQAGNRMYGMVKAHFVRLGNTADNAIVMRLRQLGKEARQWKVVSSDRRVQAEARGLGAGLVSSEQFASEVLAGLREGSEKKGDKSLPLMSNGEMDDYMKMFGGEDEDLMDDFGESV
jgi:predicted RNA-binding protein with PIN domain